MPDEDGFAEALTECLASVKIRPEHMAALAVTKSLARMLDGCDDEELFIKLSRTYLMSLKAIGLTANAANTIDPSGGEPDVPSPGAAKLLLLRGRASDRADRAASVDSSAS